MNIDEEIRLHNSDGDCTAAGPNAIRLSLSPTFQPPELPGYHVYSHSGEYVDTKPTFQDAKEVAQYFPSIVVWRDDLNPSPNAD